MAAHVVPPSPARSVSGTSSNNAGPTKARSNPFTASTPSNRKRSGSYAGSDVSTTSPQTAALSFSHGTPKQSNSDTMDITAKPPKSSKLVDQLAVTTANLQKQRDADILTMEQQIRKLEHRMDMGQVDYTRRLELSERWAQAEGDAKGLFEEVQKLARKLEHFDESLRARTGGFENLKQRNDRLEQKVQALEHHKRVDGDVAQEAQKQHSLKLDRMERAIEALTLRVIRAEEAVVPRAGKSSGAPVIRGIQQLQERVNRLEEKDDEPIADSIKHTQVAICDVVLQVSELTQRATKSDGQLAILHERLNEISRGSEEKDNLRSPQFSRTSNVQPPASTKVSQQISAVRERLLEFEMFCEVALDAFEQHESCTSERYQCRQSALESSSEAICDDDGGSKEIERRLPARRSELVEQALHRLQTTCLKAAEDIAQTVQKELLELQASPDSARGCSPLPMSSQPEVTEESCRSTKSSGDDSSISSP